MARTLLYWSPAVATASLIAWLSHQPDLPSMGPAFPSEILHFIAYGFLTLTLVFATTRGFDGERRTPARPAVAALIAAVYGITDEWHQSFIPGRDPALSDWLADALGAVVMAALMVAAWRRMAAPKRRV